ncbi:MULTISPECIES: phosphoribosyltransferase [Pyrobaculum]|uniref:Phosphoribosyltransferase n=2 Tax=Pyrobaculum arsenaticum TaxID=121277 RepID=A4WM94_PYRAR|nr:phosphoribosyltransferase [Pyrobaculum arsenaticum]ABP51511.1 phosphoribosyltransferase [Pyrobaculum arsenaticum DSM 13514]MCY0890989.1 phosphoribosyltransferase [Pyrobaculum arsenaticum]NYR16520.1 phosphoribosyltransferase [Pyrobaculum arsenaticum]
MAVEIGGIKVRFITWAEGVALSEALARKVEESGYVPDVVVAISRGGLVPARIISDVLGVDDVISIGVKYWGLAHRRAEKPVLYHSIEPGVIRDRKTLVVDEVADTGHTLMLAKNLLDLMGAREVKTAVLHLKTTSRFIPDYYAEKIEEWIWLSYPWSRHEDYREFKKKGHDISMYINRIC